MRLKPTACVPLALLSAISGCGSTRSQSAVPVTVTVTAPLTTTAPRGPASERATGQPTTTAAAPAQTRTAPGPAFTHTTAAAPGGGDLDKAVARVRALGFTPFSTSTYDQNQTLRVLLGARAGSADGHTQQAFFFNGARYLGTDAAATSGKIAVTAHGDTDVTLRYGIYRPGDADCCPSGASRTVHFTLDGGRLRALDPLPELSARR